MSSPWRGKRVLLTGPCGTVGRQLLQQLVDLHPAEIVGIDNNESELFLLTESLRSREGIRLYLGDVRDPSALERRMEGIDIVLHTAALKHVFLCEGSPRDAIQTNVLGVQNVIDAAVRNSVERVIFTSSDKAVNPTSVMGTSKLMGERLMAAANSSRSDAHPIFACTRFGNVLGSRGSVIPLFRQQVRAGGPVTLTDPRMTRFIMTLSDAVTLVMESVFLAQGGEVFVTKMPVVRIEALARAMVEELAPRHGYLPGDIEVQVVGRRPGEKLFEELLNEEEKRRAIELERYFVILPTVDLPGARRRSYPGQLADHVEASYNSASGVPMPEDELRLYLHRHGLLEDERSRRG